MNICRQGQEKGERKAPDHRERLLDGVRSLKKHLITQEDENRRTHRIIHTMPTYTDAMSIPSQDEQKKDMQ